jgi:hypothetical protein
MVDIFIDCKAGPLLTSSLATDAFPQAVVVTVAAQLRAARRVWRL